MSNLVETLKEKAAKPRLPTSVQFGFSDSAGFELMQRAAKLLSASTLVPQQFRGNIADCVIAIEMARRLGASPLAVMQSMYIVHGRPSWSAQFVIACLNSSGRFSPLRFEMRGEGDTRACTAWAIEIATGERVEGPEASIAMAKTEGWYDRKTKDGGAASKWPSMPELMLRYRAATFFGRLYAPDIMMGMQTREEIEDLAIAAWPQPFNDNQEGVNGWRDSTGSLVPPPTQEEPEPETEAWPRKNGLGQNWLDSEGAIYNSAVHGWNAEDARPSVTANGVFRRRRVAGAPTPLDEWPKKTPDGSIWVDSAGETFDTNKHTWPAANNKPSVNAFGEFLTQVP